MLLVVLYRQNCSIHFISPTKALKKRTITGLTYNMEMPQFRDALSAAMSKRARPTKVTVGTMVNGVIHLSRSPISPDREMKK